MWRAVQLSSAGGVADDTLRPHWRGRLGLAKQEQLDLFATRGASAALEEGSDEDLQALPDAVHKLTGCADEAASSSSSSSSSSSDGSSSSSDADDSSASSESSGTAGSGWSSDESSGADDRHQTACMECDCMQPVSQPQERRQS